MIRLQLNSRSLPFLVLAAAFFQLMDPNRVWLTLLVALIGVLLLAYLWARALARGLRLSRERRYGWVQVGDQLEERFTLENRAWIPAAWVEVRDESTAPGYSASRVTGVEGNGRNTWRTEGVCSQRGLFTLGPTSLHTGDPLGIFSVHIQYRFSTQLMVMPPVIPLPEIRVAPGGRSGEGRPVPVREERTVSASGVRPHVPGEGLRLIHWPTTARRNDFYVRVLEGSPAGNWWILLDLHRKTQVGSGPDSTSEHGVILAASLADRGLREGRPVGLLINGEKPVLLPPQAGEYQRLKILRELALAAQGDSSLSALLSSSRQSLGQAASLVLVTADCSGNWLENLIPLLWSGLAPTILLLDPYTFDPARARAEEAEALLSSLAELGLACYRISKTLLDQPEARPGQAGHWEFRFTPTGRAVPVRRPADTGWKTLG